MIAERDVWSEKRGLRREEKMKGSTKKNRLKKTGQAMTILGNKRWKILVEMI